MTFSSNIITFPNGGINLPTIRGSSSILNFYQEFTRSFASSFPVGIGNITIRVVRIRKLVVLTVDPKTFYISFRNYTEKLCKYCAHSILSKHKCDDKY
jgi:hypothetical protein